MVLICYGWEEICLHMWSLRECMKIDSLKSRNEIYKSGEASDSLSQKSESLSSKIELQSIFIKSDLAYLKRRNEYI